MSYNQFAVFRPVFDPPLKSSTNCWVQPEGVGGAEALAAPVPASEAARTPTATSARLESRRRRAEVRACVMEVHHFSRAGCTIRRAAGVGGTPHPPPAGGGPHRPPGGD